MVARLLASRRRQFIVHAVAISTGTLYYGFRQTRNLHWNENASQPPPAITRTDVSPQRAIEDKEKFEKEQSGWAGFVQTVNATGDSIKSIEWGTLGNKIVDAVVPEWVQVLPGRVEKLVDELNVAPDSLAAEVWQEADDATINPEINWQARVRIGKEICPEEKAFLAVRKEEVRRALARYLNVSEKEIHPDDVPIIAMCGSGGGLRALVAGTSSYLSAQEAGLFDCVTYTAGVSGSCWLQALYHSSIGRQDNEHLIKHLKARLGTHIAFPPTALQLLTAAPTNKYLLSGIIEKAKGDPDANYGLVDVYGTLLAARLLVPKGDLSVDPRDLKLSNQQNHLSRGKAPLPIYTAVRHEIPPEIEEEAKSLPAHTTVSGHARKQTGPSPSGDESSSNSDVSKADQHPSKAMKEKAKQEAWFQWFESTPYEFWCEEMEAGIPSWSLGRRFNNGISTPRENGYELPELRIPQLLGIWGSAFCATLSHYYTEVRPLVSGLAGFHGFDDIMAERDEDLVKVHPIAPAQVANYAVGLKDRLPASCPESLHKVEHLQLMDAGMSNNLPIYPLLRPGREVDMIIAFDASADVKKDNWLSVVDGYVKQRGIRGWPVGSGWPKEGPSNQQLVRDLADAQATSAEEAAERLDEARDARGDSEGRSQKPQDDQDTHNSSNSGDTDLTYCNVWVGTTQERSEPTEPPPSKRLFDSHDKKGTESEDDTWLLTSPTAGLTVIYFPLLPNPKVPGVDPTTSDFMSTWNFIYTPDQVDKVVDLARANFDEGKEQTRRCVRAVWERKRKLRQENEAREWREQWWIS